MIITRWRRVAIFAFALVCVVAVLGVGSVSRATPTVDVRPAASVAPAPVPNEDEPGWNSCTMGNLGPCDLGAVLPDHAWFEVNVGNVSLTGVSCEYPLRPVRVSVMARTDAGARVLAQEGVNVCAGGAGPELDPRVQALLPGMFRIVATHVGL